VIPLAGRSTDRQCRGAACRARPGRHPARCPGAAGGARLLAAAARRRRGRGGTL